MKKVKLISTRGKIEVGCQDHMTREAGTMVERTLSTASHIWFLSAFAALIQLLPRQGVNMSRLIDYHPSALPKLVSRTCAKREEQLLVNVHCACGVCLDLRLA